MNCLLQEFVKKIVTVLLLAGTTGCAVPLAQTPVAGVSLLPGSSKIAKRSVVTGLQYSRANVAGASKSKSESDPANETKHVVQGEPLQGEKIQKIFRTDRCGDLSRGGFIWFTDKVALDNWLTPPGTQIVEDTELQIDFATQGVLLVDFGVAATPGAGTEIVTDQLLREDGKAFFTIRQHSNQAFGKKPSGKKPGTKRRIQVITHPCTLYSMPRHGYDVLVIQNEFGEQLASIRNR